MLCVVSNNMLFASLEMTKDGTLSLSLNPLPCHHACMPMVYTVKGWQCRPRQPTSIHVWCCFCWRGWMWWCQVNQEESASSVTPCTQGRDRCPDQDCGATPGWWQRVWACFNPHEIERPVFKRTRECGMLCVHLFCTFAKRLISSDEQGNALEQWEIPALNATAPSRRTNVCVCMGGACTRSYWLYTAQMLNDLPCRIVLLQLFAMHSVQYMWDVLTTSRNPVSGPLGHLYFKPRWVPDC